MANKVIFFKIYYFFARIFFRLVMPPYMLFKLNRAISRAAKDKKLRKERGEKPRLLWGPVPIINNRYYSNAMREAGYDSITLMESFYEISKKADFDMYFSDFNVKSHPFWAFDFFYYRYALSYEVFIYVISNYDIIHRPFLGGFLKGTKLAKQEGDLLKKAGCKVVVLGYGADFFRYSKVFDPSWLHGLLSHYPDYARKENILEEAVSYWRLHADAIINGLHIDQLGRWEALPFRNEVIDLKMWKPREHYSDNDGINGVVKLVHAPNHRVIKGTEYLIQAVKELQEEGLKIELILLEKRPNEEVKQILHEQADIFFDQSVMGYALSAIEGFASGLPVLTNLEIEYYTRVFRRYSFLNECPALSVTNETIKKQLRILVRNPKFRRTLGEAGRKYAEKYHAYSTAQNLFSKLYDKIWFEKKGVNLINLYHPLFPESYNNSLPLIKHPLVENQIPFELYQTLQK